MRLIIVILVLLISCTKKEAVKEQENQANSQLVMLSAKQAQNVNIGLCKIENRPISREIAVNGMLHVPPQNLVSITAVGGGFIENTSLLPGSKVYKGQTIVSIHNPEYITLQQDYIEAKNKLEYLELEFQRQETLSTQNITSAQALQSSTADYKTIKTKVKALAVRLKAFGFDPNTVNMDNITQNLSIKSPINGYVTKVNVNIGKFVNPTDVLFEIANTQHLHIELNVFEKDISFLQKGQKILVGLPDGSKQRKAYIHLIGREIAADRTIAVHAHLEKEDTELIPGMYVKALIESGNKQTFCLPDEAICFSNNTKIIFVKRDKNIYEAIQVVTGDSDKGYTEIIIDKNNELLNAQIVCKGNYSLLAKKDNVDEE